MDLTPYITSLRDDLTAAAAAGDDNTRRTASALSAALEPAMRLALMNALADLAAEVTANLPEHLVDVRLNGRDVRVVVTATGSAAPKAEEPAAEQPRSRRSERPSFTAPIDAGDISRITLRMFEQVKGQAEKAAAAQGVSLNTFVSQAVQGALQGKNLWGESEAPEKKNTDSRLHGWVQG